MSDVLSDILDTVEMKAAVYFRTEFHAPFGVAVPAFHRASRFHLIIQGHCFVRLENGSVVKAMPGDLIFVPNGCPHLLASDSAGDCKPLGDVISEAGFQGQGPFVIGAGPAGLSCQMVCGHFSFADGSDHPLLRAVPAMLHITAAERAAQPMLDDVLRLLVRRMFGDGVGTTASINRLSEVFFIEVIRASVARADGEKNFITAVYDPQIGTALGLIHGNVAKPWTVDDLATAVGMSRSRFAERFRALVGTTPMAYLSDWRMQKALHLLNEPKGAIKAVAPAVGYRSAAAFSRAFSEHFGRTPREQQARVRQR